ncbi:MAG: hypothetical protein JNN12_11740 [Bacteroidetes Order II. Incertae sedis bacterium]|nr:hypothetical protein [Bacteroidetes Order II. bacterium]
MLFPQNPQNGDLFTLDLNGTPLPLIYVAGGVFEMGSTEYRDETPHEVEVSSFWMGLSPGSAFVGVQKKKDEYKRSYAKIRDNVEEEDIPFHFVSARTGQDISGLQLELSKAAKKLPDYGMPMPPSWIAVTKWLHQNLQLGEKRIRIFAKKDFVEKVFVVNGVPADAWDLLFAYLFHNGFIYTTKN